MVEIFAGTYLRAPGVREVVLIFARINFRATQKITIFARIYFCDLLGWVIEKKMENDGKLIFACTYFRAPYLCA